MGVEKGKKKKNRTTNQAQVQPHCHGETSLRPHNAAIIAMITDYAANTMWFPSSVLM